jgi:2-polyprenyl-3-methyl-5-hydroxy-6-metoxy-1,4-benzoquinol methylase
MYDKYKPRGTSLDIGTGHGVLYHHLDHEGVATKDTYLGIDISSKAIEQASQLYPCVNFQVLDYDKDQLSGRYDVIIFNETLYYFTSVAATVKKCVQNNLKKNGIFIVSIYDYPGHDKVTEKLLKVCKPIDQEVIRNDRGQSWTVYVMLPHVNTAD